MAVASDVFGRIAGVIDQNFLSDEEQPAGRLEAGVTSKVPSSLTELHQVDARQVASRVVEEHVLAARIAGVDPTAVGAGVPVVDRRVVLHAGVAAVPSTVGHPVDNVLRLIRRAFLAVVGDPTRGPIFALLNRLHEVVGDADREVRVLEHDRAVGFAIEVGSRSHPFGSARVPSALPSTCTR